jgi:hypothetical protein
MNDEFNGRGHAWLQVDQLKPIIELRRKKFEMTDLIAQKLEEVIRKVLPKKVQIAQAGLYRSWEIYIKRFCRVGGVIEASPICAPSKVLTPSVSFFIEPHGETKLIGSFDKFEATKYVNAGCFFP